MKYITTTFLLLLIFTQGSRPQEKKLESTGGTRPETQPANRNSKSKYAKAPNSKVSVVQSAPTTTKVAVYSEKFKVAAFHASKAIERVPVLEESPIIYDSRLAEAEKMVDEADLAADVVSIPEQEIVTKLKAELLHQQLRREKLLNAQRAAQSNRASYAAMGLRYSAAAELSDVQTIASAAEAVRNDKLIVLPQIQEALRTDQKLTEIK